MFFIQLQATIWPNNQSSKAKDSNYLYGVLSNNWRKGNKTVGDKE